MDSNGLAAALQDSAASLYHNSITPLLQRCATYIAQPNTEPLLPSLAMQRSLQHSDNLKWQQDMFHRLLHLLCLHKEGLASLEQLASCKRQVLVFLESTHPDGEWPEFTRDKLLFLQDLLFASCISETEYHVAKKPLILRLADQGAIIDAEDFIFDRSTSCDAKVMRSKSMVKTPSRRAKVRSTAESDTSRMPARKLDTDVCTKASSTSPLKQVVGAVCRFNRTPSHVTKTEKEATPPRVPHALDFLRPEHCPVRDPPSPHQAYQRMLDSPISHDLRDQQEESLSVTQPAPSADDVKDGDVCNWFSSPPSSPKCNAMVDAVDPPLLGHMSPIHHSKSPVGTPSRFRNVLTGFIQKKAPQPEVDKSSKVQHSSKRHNAEGEEDKVSSTTKGSKWGLEMLRFPKKLQFDQEECPVGNPKKNISDNNPGISEGKLFPIEGGEQSPNTKKLKRRVRSQGGPSDFIIDKVLGENIKNELSRIRAEMNKAQPGQTFSNEQIDAIATKLPMEKAELKKFFPQTWCERYGDIVLDVVQKEFKEHVGEMHKLGKGGKDKQQHPALSSPSSYHNDENLGASSPLEHHQQHQLPRRNPNFSKCFTTLDENSPASNILSWGSSPRKQPLHGNNLGSPLSPNVEKSKCKLSLQHRHSRRLTKDTTSAEENLLEEEILKMPLRPMNEYGSHLRA